MKKSHFSKLLLLALLVITTVFCVSCASLFSQAPLYKTNSRDYNAPFDDVWTAAIDVMSDANFPILTLEKESGLLVTDWVIYDESPWLDLVS